MREPGTAAIRAELERALEAPEFKNSKVLQRFLSFVVTETIEGRSHLLKSLVIAQAVFDRGPHDEGAENAVRTAAVRLRTALNSYNARKEAGADVTIELPKGRYVPTFAFAEPDALPTDTPKAARFRRPSMWVGALAVAALLITLIAAVIPVASTTLTRLVSGGSTTLAREPVIVVQPPGAVDTQSSELADEIARQLAPHMAAIAPVQIVDARRGSFEGTSHEWPLFLQPHVDAASNAVSWELVDSNGVIRWSDREKINSDRSDGVRRAISRIAFKVLGENGALPLLMERRQGEHLARTTCTIRARLLLRMETDGHFNEMRSCLTQHLEINPNDPAAWATLGTWLAVRTRYHTATGQPEYDSLVSEASHAVAKAGDLAPNAYLTQVAQMQLALSLGNVDEFLTLQKRLRDSFPGDLYLHLRIASRLARLGQGNTALEIYREARRNDISLVERGAELALAHLVEGNVDRALTHIMRTESTQQYVLVLKAALLGLAQRSGEADPVIDELLAYNPQIREQFYPWFRQLHWNVDLLNTIERGLASAGLDVHPMPEELGSSADPFPPIDPSR